MSARVLQLAHVSPSCDLWRGYGAYELLREVSGRAPLFSARTRAWTCGPWRTADAIALWESRGGQVEIVDEAHLLRLAGHEVDGLKAAHAEARGALW
jgi:hypothetical protein